MSKSPDKTFSVSWITGRGASVIALAGFMGVSIFATAMGFQDLRLANLDQSTLSWQDSLPVWALTVFVILAMVAALNAALGVGFTTSADGKKQNRYALRSIAAFFYLFFAFWSVGFGYGFFWKELAGQEYTQGQFRAAIEEVSRSESGAADALNTVESAVRSASETARDRADEEANNGGTCANYPNSQPGDGPLTRARFAFADRAEALREDVNLSWTSKLEEQRSILQRRITTLSKGVAPLPDEELQDNERQLLDSLAAPGNLTPEAREEVFAIVFEDARDFTARANNLRATYAETFAGRLDELRRVVGPDPNNSSQANPARAEDRTYCWDIVLTEKLSAASQSLRNLSDMPSPEFEFTEGPKATRAAFFNLARATTSPITGNGAPFGEKEFIALFASIAVDAGILFLTLVRAAMERTGSARVRRDPKPFDLNDMRRLAARADPKHVAELGEEDENGVPVVEAEVLRPRKAQHDTRPIVDVEATPASEPTPLKRIDEPNKPGAIKPQLPKPD